MLIIIKRRVHRDNLLLLHAIFTRRGVEAGDYRSDSQKELEPGWCAGYF